MAVRWKRTHKNEFWQRYEARAGVLRLEVIAEDAEVDWWVSHRSELHNCPDAIREGRAKSLETAKSKAEKAARRLLTESLEVLGG